MSWIKTEDNANVLHRYVTTNQRIEIGIYPVMYGFRVRAGWVDAIGCELDWCCGDSAPLIQEALAIGKKLLGASQNEKNPFFGIPRYSVVKPFPLDPHFTRTIRNLAGTIEFEQIPDLNVLRAKWREMWRSY